MLTRRFPHSDNTYIYALVCPLRTKSASSAIVTALRTPRAAHFLGRSLEVPR